MVTLVVKASCVKMEFNGELDADNEIVCREEGVEKETEHLYRFE